MKLLRIFSLVIVLKLTTEQRGRINQAFITSYSFISWKGTNEVSFLFIQDKEREEDHEILWTVTGWQAAFV